MSKVYFKGKESIDETQFNQLNENEQENWKLASIEQEDEQDDKQDENNNQNNVLSQNKNKNNNNDDDEIKLQDLRYSNTQILAYDDISFQPIKFPKEDTRGTMYAKQFGDEQVSMLNTAFQKKDFQQAVCICATQRIGGKGKEARKKQEKIIMEHLKTYQLYKPKENEDYKISYKGLLKYAPHQVMAIWRANKPKDEMYDGVDLYANGIETQFKPGDLKDMGMTDADLRFCYARLVKQLEIVLLNPKNDLPWRKLVARYINFESEYDYPALRERPEVRELLIKAKAIDSKSGGNIDINRMLNKPKRR